MAVMGRRGGTRSGVSCGRRIALAIAFAATLAWGPPTSAQVPGDDAEALIRRGTELRHQGQDAQALPYFEGAYRLSRNPRTAAQLGLVKMALGYCVEAERLLGEALAVPDHPWISRNQVTLEKTRAGARKSIGEIAVTGTPAGAEVLLNGRSAGHLPLAAPLRLDKGLVELQVRAPAHAIFTRSFTIAGGEHETIVVALVPLAVAPPPAAPPAPAAAAAPAPASRPAPSLAAPMTATDTSATARETGAAIAPQAGPDRQVGPAAWIKRAAWIAAGGAAAGLALGIIETVVAANRIDEFNSHTSPTPEDPNRGTFDCQTSELTDTCRSIRDARDRARALAIVGYVGASVLGAASAALFVLGGRQAPTGRPVARTRRADGLICAPAVATPGFSCRLRF
jgi:hypothetical protein